jgi:hypothetical protein
MHKIILVAVSACALAGCTVREQQLATAGVAGAIVGSALTAPAPSPRPYYVEQPQYIEQPRYIAPPRRRPHCYAYWENTRRGYVERTVCGNHIP